MDNPNTVVLNFVIISIAIAICVYLFSHIKIFIAVIRSAMESAIDYEKDLVRANKLFNERTPMKTKGKFWELKEKVADLTGDIASLTRQVKQLECKHPKNQRIYKPSRAFGFDVSPMREICKECDKQMRTLNSNAWAKKELQIAEEKVKELKKNLKK